MVPRSACAAVALLHKYLVKFDRGREGKNPYKVLHEIGVGNYELRVDYQVDD